MGLEYSQWRHMENPLMYTQGKGGQRNRKQEEGRKGSVPLKSPLEKWGLFSVPEPNVRYWLFQVLKIKQTVSFPTLWNSGTSRVSQTVTGMWLSWRLPVSHAGSPGFDQHCITQEWWDTLEAHKPGAQIYIHRQNTHTHKVENLKLNKSRQNSL